MKSIIVRIPIHPERDADLLADWKKYDDGQGAAALRAFWRAGLAQPAHPAQPNGQPVKADIDPDQIRLILRQELADALAGLRLGPVAEDDGELAALEAAMDANLLWEDES